MMTMMMISRNIRHMRIPKGIAYPIVQLTPIRLNATKVLKPSSFSFPTTPPPPPPPQQQQQQEEEKQPRNTLVGDFADDFKVTRLVQGETDLKLGITQRASDKLNQIKRDDGNNDAALAIKVESGGCHGFQYNLKLIDVSKDAGSDEFIFERDGGKVVLDESSLMILQDSKVDYTKELIGSQFKIVDSPYTSSACGCGSSFDFDFDKLEEKSK